MVQRESMVDRVSFDAGLGLEISELLKAPVIPTGAGHDAGVLAAHVPTAMLFVRNPSPGYPMRRRSTPTRRTALVGVEALADVLENLVR